MADTLSPSHEWRKLYGHHFASSERLASVSYEARWLYVLVLGLQDDRGAYPWTNTMIRTLTATTEWSFKTATGFRDELIAHGLGRMDGTMFVIHNGQKFNGVTKSGKTAGIERTYLGTTWVLPETDLGSTSVEQDETRLRREDVVARASKKRVGATAPNPLISETMQELERVRGYPSPIYAAEAKAVKWMLDHGYLKTDMLACYAYLKQDPWRATKPLTMPSVQKEIAEWIAHGRLAAPPQRPSTNGVASRQTAAAVAQTDDLRRFAAGVSQRAPHEKAQSISEAEKAGNG